MALLVDHAGLKATGCGPVFLNAWLCPPTIDQLDRLAVAQHAFGKEVPQHVVVSLVDPRVGKVMDEASRARAKKLSDEMQVYTLGHCYVVLGTGFFAAMARSVITGIQLVGRSSKPWKVAADIPAASGWAVDEAKKHGLDVDRAALEKAAADLVASA